MLKEKKTIRLPSNSQSITRSQPYYRLLAKSTLSSCRFSKNKIERFLSGFLKLSVSEKEMYIARRARTETRQFPCNDNKFSNLGRRKEDYYFPLLHGTSDAFTFPVESKGHRRVHTSYYKRRNEKATRSNVSIQFSVTIQMQKGSDSCTL